MKAQILMNGFIFQNLGITAIRMKTSIILGNADMSVRLHDTTIWYTILITVNTVRTLKSSCLSESR
jgi:hypothetical protein